MRVIPVIDLKGGQVVRAIAGRRHEYAPIQSQLVSSSAAADVARTFVDRFACREVYVADIDALQGRTANDAALHAILATGVHVWLDRGVKSSDELAAQREATSGAANQVSVILASETIPGPDALAALVRSREIGNAIFSLDLKNQAALAAEAWNQANPAQIVDVAVRLGLRRFIVLDLARVGVSTGTGTVDLCRQMRREHPGIELFAGGGVRSLADLRELHDAGCSGALVATALHDGRLTVDDLKQAAAWGEI